MFETISIHLDIYHTQELPSSKSMYNPRQLDMVLEAPDCHNSGGDPESESESVSDSWLAGGLTSLVNRPFSHGATNFPWAHTLVQMRPLQAQKRLEKKACHLNANKKERRYYASPAPSSHHPVVGETFLEKGCNRYSYCRRTSKTF